MFLLQLVGTILPQPRGSNYETAVTAAHCPNSNALKKSRLAHAAQSAASIANISRRNKAEESPTGNRMAAIHIPQTQNSECFRVLIPTHVYHRCRIGLVLPRRQTRASTLCFHWGLFITLLVRQAFLKPLQTPYKTYSDPVQWIQFRHRQCLPQLLHKLTSGTAFLLRLHYFLRK